jgi:hypothetical protein
VFWLQPAISSGGSSCAVVCGGFLLTVIISYYQIHNLEYDSGLSSPYFVSDFKSKKLHFSYFEGLLPAKTSLLAFWSRNTCIVIEISVYQSRFEECE